MSDLRTSAKYGPNAFVIVGDVERWSLPSRSLGVSLNRNMRRAEPEFWGSGSIGARASLARSGKPFGYYAEFYLDFSGSAVTDLRVGLLKTSSTWDHASALTAEAGAIVITGASSGAIYKHGASAQTSLGTINGGDSFGVELYDDAGTIKAQFVKNGANYGTAVTLDDVPYCLAFEAGAASRAVLLRVDAREQRYRPSDRQPWGAAALIGDAGGYSPPGPYIDSFEGMRGECLRTLTGDGGSTWQAGISAAEQAPPARWRYFEGVFEAIASGDQNVGLTARDADLETQIGDADGWSFDASGGSNFGGANTPHAILITDGDVVGVIWDSEDGKLWFSVNGELVAGDPEAGTGAIYSSVTGDLVPGVTCKTDDRMRLCLTSAEQQFRPHYATAWGGDDLPHGLHFIGRLGTAPTVRQGVNYYPWGESERGAPIGDVGIINPDGLFDPLSDWELRDQACTAWRRNYDGRNAREWEGVVDSVELSDFATARVIVGSKLAKLDVRVESPIFALGNPYLIPTVSREGASITKDVCQTENCGFQVLDQGLNVGTWTRDDTADAAGFTRTVGTPGRMSVKRLSVFRKIDDIAIDNGDFSNWSGTPPSETPDDWTVTIHGGSIGYTRDGDAIEFSGNGTARLWQTGLFYPDKFYAMRIRFSEWSVASSYSITFRLYDDATTTTLRATAAICNDSDGYKEGGLGEFMAYITPDNWLSGTQADGFAVYISANGTVEIDTIELFEATDTAQLENALGYMLEDVGTLSASEWAFTDADFSTGTPAKFWPTAPIGAYYEDRPTVRDVVFDVLASELGDGYVDPFGVFRMAWLVPPNEFSSSDSLYLGDIAERDIIGDLFAEDDLAPQLSNKCGMLPNFAKHSDGEIAGAVDDEFRQYLTSEHVLTELAFSTSETWSASPLHPFYAFATNAPPTPRLASVVYGTTNNAAAGGDPTLIRAHRFYSRRRRAYRCAIPRRKAEALGVRPGAVVGLTHSRFGLSGGKALFIAAVSRDIVSPTVELELRG